jgi:hypothetical protein
MNARTTLATLAAILSSACTPRTAPPVSAGKRIADGPAIALASSPDGAHLAWLSGCAAAPGGRGAASCSLLVAPAAGGAPIRITDGVAPLPGAFAWQEDGSIVAMARRDPGGAGDLVTGRPGSEPRVLATRVTAFTGGPGGWLAFVSAGEVVARAPGGEPARLAGGAGSLELAFAPAPGRALAARTRDAGGVPVLVLWRGIAGEGVAVAREVGSFAFSPDGAWLAVVAGVAPGMEGNLVAVPVGTPGPAPVALGRAVGPFAWSPGASRLAWLEGFDARGNAGKLATARPGEAPVPMGDRVTAFELAAGGGQVAFVRHHTEGGYVANLDLSPTGAPAAGTVARDPAGFGFSPDGRWLWYRGGCTSAGEGCALFRAPAEGLGQSQAPERLADGVAAYVIGPGRSDRALVAFGRKDGSGVDLAAWTPGKLSPLDFKVLPGSALLLPPEGRRAAWIGTATERPGVYVADLP